MLDSILHMAYCALAITGLLSVAFILVGIWLSDDWRETRRVADQNRWLIRARELGAFEEDERGVEEVQGEDGTSE